MDWCKDPPPKATGCAEGEYTTPGPPPKLLQWWLPGAKPKHNSQYNRYRGGHWNRDTWRLNPLMDWERPDLDPQWGGLKPGDVVQGYRLAARNMAFNAWSYTQRNVPDPSPLSNWLSLWKCSGPRLKLHH